MSSSNGIFPQGATPEQVMDLTGNVWEWCLGTYSDPQADPAVEELTATGFRPLRGGSWYRFQGLARAVCRSAYSPYYRYSNISVFE
jgi:formylglycine-generating enzyme required for sulfatase activity